MRKLNLAVLGPPRLSSARGPVAVVHRKPLALLIYLAVTGQAHRRDTLATLLWPNNGQRQARANLRKALFTIVQALGTGLLELDGEMVAVRPSARLTIDVTDFMRLAAGCGAHRPSPAWSCPCCQPLLEQAAELYRGEFLEGFTLTDSRQFDDWELLKSEEVRLTAARVLRCMAEGREAAGRFDDALRYGKRWVSIDPIDEEARRALMRLYATAGQRPAALRQYEDLRRMLRQELDAEPEPETTDLVRLIREGAVAPNRGPTLPAVDSDRRGDLRLVTVLAAGMSATADDTWERTPEEAASRLAPFRAAVEEVLRRFEVRSQQGPSHDVMAVFGASASHEDEAERAVRAAFLMLDAAGEEKLSISVGIHTGLVAVESPAVSGSPLACAARLRFLAGPGEVLVSSATVHHTRGAIEYQVDRRAQGSRPGRPRIFRAVAVRPRSEKSYGVRGMRAPMLGRDVELESLRGATDAAVRGRGVFVEIVGEAGIGKSRLLHELRAKVNPEVKKGDLSWLQGRCLELGRSESYWPLREALAGWFNIAAGDAPETIADRLQSGLALLRGARQLDAEGMGEVTPVLGAFFGARFGNDLDQRLRSIDPNQVRQRTLSALEIVVRALTRVRPLVLVLDDVHWADPLSLDAVVLLMEAVADERLLLICAFRPEPDHRSASLAAVATRKCPDRFIEIRLRELADDESRRQVASMLGVRALPAEVEAILPARLRGNPFFTEEYVRSLVDAGSLYQQDTRWRARSDRPAPAVPANVLVITQSRVDRLDEEARVVLQGASIVGPSFTSQLAAAAVPAPVDVQRALETLCRASLICEEGALPVTSYAFTHALVREAVYAALPVSRRARMHADVARAVETMASADLEEASPTLAFHYDRAGIAEKAVEYLVRAGRRAERRYLNEEARADYERALVLLGPGVTPAQQRQGLAACQGLAAIHNIRAEYREAERRYLEAIQAAASLNLPTVEIADLYFKMGLARYELDEVPQARAAAEAGLSLLGQQPPSAAAANLMTLVARCNEFFDEEAFTSSSIEAARIMEMIPDLGQVASMELTRVAEAFIRLRMRGEASKWQHLAGRVADRSRDPAMAAQYLYSVGFHALFDGDLERALDCNARALDLAVRIGDRDLASFEHLYLAWCHEWRGSLEQELSHCARCIEYLSSYDQESPLSTINSSDCFRNTATALFGLGRREEGVQYLMRAIHFDRGFVRPGHILSHGVAEVGLCAKTLLVLGQRELAKDILLELFGRAPHRAVRDLVPIRLGMATALGGLEEAMDDDGEFRSFCRQYRAAHPDACRGGFDSWYLEQAPIGEFREETAAAFPGPPGAEWRWVDPFGDCSHQVRAGGLEIQAANGRDLWHLNTGAPRFLRTVWGDFAVQATCGPCSSAVPALGGICIWQDEDHFFHVERGALGKGEVTFKACIDTRSLIFGRGRLVSDTATLRLERRGSTLRALCSADGHEWLSLGETKVDLGEALEAGVFASGWIDRSYYHGPFLTGAAMRVSSIQMFH